MKKTRQQRYIERDHWDLLSPEKRFPLKTRDDRQRVDGQRRYRKLPTKVQKRRIARFFAFYN